MNRDQHLAFQVNDFAIDGRGVIAHVNDLIAFDGHTGCGGQGAVARPYFGVDEDFISSGFLLATPEQAGKTEQKSCCTDERRRTCT